MKKRECWIERLEERRMLAGNVTAEVVDGVLKIFGDAQGNYIRLEGDGTAGGAVQLSGNDTNVNLQTSLDNFSKIRINLGRGDNTLEMVGLVSDIVVGSGPGQDFISLQQSKLSGNFVAHTGGGNDVVSIFNQSTMVDGIIETGRGDDLIYLSHMGFGRKYVVRGGTGDDYLFAEEYGHTEKTSINLGSGNNRQGGGRISDLIQHKYDFGSGTHGWRAGFADYFADREDEHKLTALTPEENEEGGQFLLSGKNITDDLFMYLTKTLTVADGLKPNMAYHVRFDLDVSSNAQSGCTGIGGAPGESVFLKAGAIATAPRSFVDEDGVVRLNVDHGDQGSSGKAASLMGNIANGVECGTSQPGGGYVHLQRSGVHTAIAKTNSKGRLHLIVGTDSGFEGTTTLLYSRISVQLVEAWKLPEKEKPRPFSQRYVPVS